MSTFGRYCRFGLLLLLVKSSPRNFDVNTSRLKPYFPVGSVVLAALICTSADAGPLRALFGQHSQNGNASDNIATAPGVTQTRFEGRPMLVFAPQNLPPQGSRALVVVLHGGLGSAERVEGNGAERALSMDQTAGKYGFVVAYLNGTPASPRFSDRYAWNAGGGCCGEPYHNNIDDVGYISDAVHALLGQYGIDPHRVYGMGHSNGAMMTQRLMCETNLYASAVVVSGPLMTKTSGSCSTGRGKAILAIHGAQDDNVPINGGQGAGPSNVAFNSEARTQQVWSNTGANYQLDVVQGADHKVENINNALQRSDGISIAEKAARFFGLAH
jgi:polyhydroxybutyrate depolymerase